MAKGKYDGIRWSISDGGVLTISGKGDIPDFSKKNGEEPTVADRPWAEYRQQVKELVVEKGITRIGDRAFQNFKSLHKAEIAPTVKSVGKWAFQNCGSLTDISISENTMLKTGSFRGTPVLAEVKGAEKTAYTTSDYYRKLCEVPLTGNFREDMINIAKSQDGYHEGDSEADFDGMNTESKKDYTEFGRYLDSAGSAWCSEFGSWCVRMSGLPMDVFKSSLSARAKTFTEGTPSAYYVWEDLVFGGGSYTPKPGDLVLWSWKLEDFSPDVHVSHTSIFNWAEPKDDGRLVFHTIDGNRRNHAGECSYTVWEKDGCRVNGKGRVCFIVSPAYDDASIEKHQVRFDCCGGTVRSESKTVAKGGLYGPLPIPSKKGAKFAGWFTEPKGGKLVNMYTIVKGTEDHTLYAHWD